MTNCSSSGPTGWATGLAPHPAQIEYARRWREIPKVAFSRPPRPRTIDWNARLVTGAPVTEITRLKTDDGGSMDIGGVTLAAAAMRAWLIDQYALVTHPILVAAPRRSSQPWTPG